MKKFLLIFLLLLLGVSFSYSQGVMGANWKVGPDKTWFKNDHYTRGIAYNPATDHILVATRTGTHRIIILNAATGDSVGVMDMTGVTGGTYALNLVGSTDDGIIYACNLITSGSSPLKIYKWTSETAAPKLVYSGNPNTNRWGDALTVVGSGANARVWVSGTGSSTGNNEVAIMKLTNDTLVIDKQIMLSDYITVMGIAPVGTTGEFWINTANVLQTHLTKFSSTGAVLDTVPYAVASDATNSVTYVELGGKKLLLVNDGTTLSARVIDVTNGGAQAKYRFTTGIVGKNANTNGTGVAVYDSKRKAMVSLVTNNQIASYNIDSLVNVTFIANTATVPDTLKAGSFVQIRGDDPLFGPWGKTGLVMTNIGGDYWKATAALKIGKTIPYKFFTNAVNGEGDNEHKGWENDLIGGNRNLTVPATDLELDVQFVNGTPTQQDQWFKPWTVNNDSINVQFRVNVQGIEGFNKDNQYLAVRGGFPASAGWSKNFVLKQESQHGNGGSRQYDGTNFYSGVARIPKTDAGKTTEYKFVILLKSDPSAITWESTNNRSFVNGGDTTLAWKWWEDKPPVAFKGSDTVIVTFRADLSNAIKNKGFFPGDTIYAQYGFQGTGKDMLGNSPARKYMKKTGLTGNIYTVTDTVITKIGGDFYYQYYLTKNGVDYREVFFNFDYTGSVASLAERRNYAPTKVFELADIENSVTSGRRQPIFRNTTKLARNVKVTVTCDLRPAYERVKAGNVLDDIQSTVNVTNPDSIYIWGVWINGPMTNGWTGWGGALRDSLSKKMYDDGTHGDVTSGDRIYTTQIDLLTTYSDGRERVGQEFKFGVGGGDNESGFGLNHIENIDDSQPTFLLENQFGSINPGRYKWWNYNTKSAKGGWDPMVTGTTETLKPIVVVNENVAWIAGHNGAVLKTTNGGTTWIKTISPNADYHFYSMDALDANTAWVWGTHKSVSGLGSCRIYKTTDGGTTWTQQYENTNTYGNMIAFFDANNGFAMGDPDDANGQNLVVVTTTNGGSTWTRVDASKVPALATGYYGLSNTGAKIGNTAWFTVYDDNGSSPSKIYKTTDKGATWTAYSTSTLPNGGYLYIDFKDANNGIVVTLSGGKSARTTDGGATWSAAVDIGNSEYLRNVDWIPGSKTIFAVGGTNAGICHLSTDNGATWKKVDLPSGTPILRNVKFTSGTSGYVIGNSGTALKYIGSNVVAVKTIDGNLPTIFSLSQNFPNPFNPETSIRYALPKDVKVSLRIYDMLGREVRTLVDENQPAGTYEVRFNANQLATGVYFYHLKAGDYSSIKKMMLMK